MACLAMSLPAVLGTRPPRCPSTVHRLRLSQKPTPLRITRPDQAISHTVVGFGMSALLSRVPLSPRPWLLGRGTSRAATAAAARRPGLHPSAALLNSAGLPAEAPQLVFATSGAAQHDFPGHKECAARVPAILSAIEAGGLLPTARPGQVRNLRASAISSSCLRLCLHWHQSSAALPSQRRPWSCHCLPCIYTALHICTACIRASRLARSR